MCKKVARERNARTVLRFALQTSHQSNGFVEAVHGHRQGLARCYQTQIETNTGVQLAAISPVIPFAIRYAGFVLSRFTVRPDGRTPFQYLLGTPYVSPLCMFGESVFALIPDHEVRAAKLTNKWISGCWWGRDASSDEHLVGTKHGLLKCRSVRRKPSGEQWSRRETTDARGTKRNFDVEMDSGDTRTHSGNHVQMKRCRQRRHRWKFPLHFHLAPRPEEAHTRDTSSQEPRRRRCGGHDGDGDLRPIQRGILRKRRRLGKVVRYTNIHEAPIPELLNEDGKLIDNWPDHHSTLVTSTQERHLCDDGIAGASCHFQRQVHHYCEHRLGDSCNLLGIRVPKCTRWRPQRIHNKTYRQVRGRMLEHCSNAERKGSDDAFDGTEEFESARRDDSV